ASAPAEAGKPDAVKALAEKAEDAIADAKALVAAVAQPKAAEGPNVLGGAAAARKAATVSGAELDRERSRTRSAHKAVAAMKKQIEGLQAELKQAHAEIAALNKAHAPPPAPRAPPPTDQEQILQTLAPLLQTAGDGRP